MAARRPAEDFCPEEISDGELEHLLDEARARVKEAEAQLTDVLRVLQRRASARCAVVNVIDSIHTSNESELLRDEEDPKRETPRVGS